jgi:hypothetical protein
MYEFENESKFETWEEEYNHLEKFKDKTLVKTLMDKYSINFMDLECINKSTMKKHYPDYYNFHLREDSSQFFKYDPQTCEWDKRMANFYSWDQQYEHVEKSKDTEMVESLEKTFGYSFMNDIRPIKNFEFYLISDRKTQLKYEDKTWTKSLYCDRTKAVRIPMFESSNKKIKNISYGNTCYQTYPCQHYIHEEYEDGTTKCIGLLGARTICKLFKDNGFEIPEHFK